MFLPIGDDNSSRRTFPFVNYILIALNAVSYTHLDVYKRQMTPCTAADTSPHAA